MRKTALRLCGNFRNTPSSLVKGRVWLRRDVTCSEVGLLIMTVKCFFFNQRFPLIIIYKIILFTKILIFFNKSHL